MKTTSKDTLNKLERLENYYLEREKKELKKWAKFSDYLIKSNRRINNFSFFNGLWIGYIILQIWILCFRLKTESYIILMLILAITFVVQKIYFKRAK
jgi:hypothetical protein